MPDPRLSLPLILLAGAPLFCGEVAAAKCSGPPVDLARRLVGTWQEFSVTDNGETLVGTLTTRLELGDCLLTQAFESAAGDFSFRSFGYVDANSGLWNETFVFDSGRVAVYLWNTEGEQLVLDRVGEVEGRRHRLRITQIREDSYTVWEEHSYDGARTWRTVEQTRTRRVP